MGSQERDLSAHLSKEEVECRKGANNGEYEKGQGEGEGYEDESEVGEEEGERKGGKIRLLVRLATITWVYLLAKSTLMHRGFSLGLWCCKGR